MTVGPTPSKGLRRIRNPMGPVEGGRFDRYVELRRATSDRHVELRSPRRSRRLRRRRSPIAEAAGRLTLVAVGLAEHRLDQLALVRLEAMVEGTLRVIGAEVISKGVITGTPELRRKISGFAGPSPGRGRRSAR
jgi:hypothetical protein